MSVNSTNILIVLSPEKAFDVAFRALEDPNDGVTLESPCNPMFIRSLAANDLRLLPLELVYPNATVPEDELARLIGLQLKRHAPKAVCVRANFVVPTGRNLPVPTRRALRVACASAGILLIEDDLDFELGYEGPADYPVCSIPAPSGETDLVVYVSRIPGPVALGPGLAMVYSPLSDICEAMARLARGTEGDSSLFDQRIFAGYLARPTTQSELELLRTALQQRRNALLDTLEAELGPLRDSGVGRVFWPKPFGGTSILLTLPYGHTGAAFLEACRDRVTFDLGQECYPVFHGKAKLGGNTIRLSFASEPVERIVEGARVLARVLKEILEKRAPLLK
jgi:DNA-binding transcriptional MocR family regulator